MIEFDHVSVTFQNRGKKFHAVSDVTLTVETGEFFGIVGPSGAGKSTLVRTVNRLQRTDSGSIRIDGREITGLKGRALREERLKIGMIFQPTFNCSTSTWIKLRSTALICKVRGSCVISSR